MKPSIPYEKALLEDLKDPLEAAHYLNASLEENDFDLFLLALARVARAHGMSSLAQKARLHRVSLHKMLSKNGNPEFRSILQILRASGLKLKVSPQTKKAA
jgi:probable addiction module antidote protein